MDTKSAPVHASPVNLTYLESRDRLEIHRVQRVLDNYTFVFAGAMNLATGKEFRPFLSTLSAEERRWVEELCLQKRLRSRTQSAVELERFTEEFAALVEGLQDDVLEQIPAEIEMRLTLVWQRFRQRLKNAQKAAVKQQ